MCICMYVILIFVVADIEECETNNGECQHNCNNTDGSYYCSCNNGYFLNDDKHTCDGIVSSCFFNAELALIFTNN